MKLPDSRAFLVRVSEATDPAAREPNGRIEHIESGLRARFSSAEEMRSFMMTTLVEEADIETTEKAI